MTNTDSPLDDLDKILNTIKYTVLNHKVTEKDWESEVWFEITEPVKQKFELYCHKQVIEGYVDVVQLILNTCKYEGRELYLSTGAVESLIEDLKSGSDKHKVFTALDRIAELRKTL